MVSSRTITKLETREQRIVVMLRWLLDCSSKKQMKHAFNKDKKSSEECKDEGIGSQGLSDPRKSKAGGMSSTIMHNKINNKLTIRCTKVLKALVSGRQCHLRKKNSSSRTCSVVACQPRTKINKTIDLPKASKIRIKILQVAIEVLSNRKIQLVTKACD